MRRKHLTSTELLSLTQDSTFTKKDFYKLLVLAQVFCLMPVRGICSRTVKGLSFRWKSFRTWYCLLYIACSTVDTALTLYAVSRSEVEVIKLQSIIFHFSILLSSVSFMRLAIKWPNLMHKWELVQGHMPKHRNWYEREELARRIKHVAFVFISLSLMEHLLSTISGIHYANYCSSHTDPMREYFRSVVSHIFEVFEFNYWLAIYGKIINVLMTFGWTYTDLFLIIVGIGLSALFKQLRRSMETVQGQYMPESYWTRTRLQYRLICELIEEVDEDVSFLTMISFSSNLYFVCIQLLSSLNKMPSVAHAVYFYFSLFFLLSRMLAVSLFLAEVNDSSREPLRLLKFVPTECYYTEVERLAYELATDMVAMTGLKYFSVTRKLVLTVAGTVVTYELVLIQFHEEQILWDCGTA